MIERETIGSEKERIRQNLLDREILPAGVWGKVAERIRHIPAYERALCVMVSPAPFLNQVRINALADRKHLVLPTPGVQKGFLHIDPNRVPVKKWSFAVRSTQTNPFAEKIPYGKRVVPPIDLLVVDALAAGRDGTLLGTGQGHLDLQYAVLFEMGWLSSGVRVIAVVEEDRIFPLLPSEEDTDVGAHWIVTPQNIYETACRKLPEAGVVWDRLDRKKIRRNDAVFYLFRQKEPR